MSVRVAIPTPVIVLNWNGWEDTFACLGSIYAVDPDCLVWLVDNGSEADRTEEASAAYPTLRVMRWERNFGWAGGNNRALAIAAAEGYEFAYLLNNDCIVTPRFLKSVLDVATRDSSFAAVGSRISFADPAGYVFFDGEARQPYSRPLVASDEVIPCATLSGAGMLVRLSAMEQHGYFDESFFCYFEESEWCLRLRDHGWRHAVCSASIVVHDRLGSDVGSNEAYYMTRNKFLFRRMCRLARAEEPGISVLYRAIRTANDARQRHDALHASAIADALWHVLRRKYGERGANAPMLFEYVLTHCWPFPRGFFRSHLELPGRKRLAD